MTPEQPSDPELRTLVLPSGPVAYTDEGAGLPVVALHGLPGSVRDFRWLAPTLSGVRLLRLDQPGFGDSPLSTQASARPARRARLVLDWLDALGVDRFVPMGHSFGGLLASEVARLAGPRARGLALLASVGHRPHRGLSSLGWPLGLSLALRLGPARARLMPRLREGYRKAGFPEGLPDQALTQTVHIVAASSFPRHAANLAALRVPSFLAWTEDDRLIEPEISEALYWRAPAGPRVAFPTGGHNLQKTRAVELGHALSAWAATLA